MKIRRLPTAALFGFLIASISILGCGRVAPTQPGNSLHKQSSLSEAGGSSIAPGVMAWWPGDGSAIDIVGGNDGTLQNGVTYATGQVLQAFDLNGVNAFVEGNAPGLPQGSNPRSYDAWIFPRRVSGANTIFNYGTFATNQRNGMLLVNGRLYFVGENNDVIGNTPIPADEWTHVAITLSGSSVNLYVNGVLDRSATLPVGPHNTTGTNWAIGKGFRGPYYPEWFNGLIDEVEVYDRVLSASEIETIFDAGSRGNKPTKLVEICHMHGTPAEETLVIPVQALPAHLGHGDVLGACN